VEAGKTAVPGDKVVVPNTTSRVVLRKTPTLLALRRVQRQFINYTKQNPVSDAQALAGLFVDFINASDAVA
jgi:tRNA uridine 5-carbamoylmethylation protein Kti12